MYYGDIIESDKDPADVIDECMTVFMKAPHTYTGEDVVEIQCHGSFVSLRRILSLVLRLGALPAERGEFTKRAFLNGRLDLTQAEAVIDVIKAKTDAGSAAAVKQLQGSLSDAIRSIRKDMADLISDIVAHIEYPEEDLEELTYASIIEKLNGICQEVQKMIDSADTGRTLRDGLRLAIVGRPNVGKSSLMNAVLRTDRAIVTDIPGTTRDTIEESASIAGIPVIITDTAGIRDTDDMIEKIGIEKSRESIINADVVVVMLDGSSDLSDDDIDILEAAAGKKCIIILNKTDAGSVVKEENVRSVCRRFSPDFAESCILSMSVANGQGTDAFSEEIRRIVYNGEASAENDIMITNARHEQLLRDALQLMKDSSFMLENGEALDFAESDIREAWMKLGEITGDAVADDIVTEVFSRFCLGK